MPTLNLSSKCYFFDIVCACRMPYDLATTRKLKPLFTGTLMKPIDGQYSFSKIDLDCLYLLIYLTFLLDYT